MFDDARVHLLDAKRVLTVTHGADSALVQQLVEFIATSLPR
jgi:hypothetical protein